MRRAAGVEEVHVPGAPQLDEVDPVPRAIAAHASVRA